MRRRTFLASLPATLLAAEPRAGVLEPESFRHYIDDFNHTFQEEVVNYVPDAQAWDFLKANIPFFTCPDTALEQVYYYRWWTYRKHLKQTPEGLIVTEFLKPVKHAAEYNALSCAFGHHVAEGRWLRDRRFLDQCAHFWLYTGENRGIRQNFHQFSGWAAAALLDRYRVDGNREFLLSCFEGLRNDYAAWERERLTPSGLFWQRDVSDGMESSISGGRRVRNIRPSINSYMFGNAAALAEIAAMAGNGESAAEFREKAARLKQLTLERLWNAEADFFETRLENGAFAPVREEIGFTPWFCDLPPQGGAYSAAWKQLMDPAGFSAPFGLTTAERRNPEFKVAYTGDDCAWDGPAWPFATTITLRALANLLHDYRQTAVSKKDYFQVLQTYTRSQHLKMPDGRTVPFIDEDLNPLTGEWLARAMKLRKPGFYARGDHYNHSGYADLVITGLAGLRPRADGVVDVDPLLPPGTWDWFCLDGVPYHGRTLTILWDRSGGRFQKGKGLRVLADGREIAHRAELGPVTGKLSE